MTSATAKALDTAMSKHITDMPEFLEEYKVLQEKYNTSQKKFMTENIIDNDTYIECIGISQRCIRYLDTVNPFALNRNKEEVKNTYYISAELLVRTVGFNMQRTELSDGEKNTLYLSIVHARKVLSFEPMHIQAKELLKMTFMYLTLFNPNAQENIQLLRQVLSVDPCDYQLQYNLAFMYQRANQLDESVYHYKLALGITELCLKTATDKDRSIITQFKMKCLNGLGGVYFNIQDRELALYYFELAYEIDPLDPDINNQIGVVYTELRNTEKAIEHYMRGIKNYKRAHISVDKDMLIASMYMNMGLVKCYECDFEGAIDGYNQALKYKPRLSLAYQNKLLDLNYISHLIDDPMYVARLHKAINKIYAKVVDNYKESCPDYVPKRSFLTASSKNKIAQGQKLVLGFVSGDFICHPVAYFIHSVLKHLNYDLFEVHCFSAKVVDLSDMFPNCKWHLIKNTSDVELKNRIQAQHIDILFDLSTHTGDNRLDAFALKPAPIQISYCGYPNSAGIRAMDYRITDTYCDSDKSQKYYQEKFIFLKHCFLAYSPSTGLDKLPALVDTQPCFKNGYITFGCFNRYNKINKMVIGVWEKILKAAPTARFVIKTKEFLTPKLKQQFLDSFQDKSVLERVTILPYSDTYVDHLPDYNLMDISLDTFPYAGTTTSCESLAMGVPVLTLFDNVRYYHSQNVTTSLLKNSGLEEFVTYSQEEYISKAVEYANGLSKLATLKQDTRTKFLKGYVCNYTEFIDDFENKLIQTYKNHKW